MTVHQESLTWKVAILPEQQYFGELISRRSLSGIGVAGGANKLVKCLVINAGDLFSLQNSRELVDYRHIGLSVG